MTYMSRLDLEIALQRNRKALRRMAMLGRFGRGRAMALRAEKQRLIDEALGRMLVVYENNDVIIVINPGMMRG